MGHKDGVDLVKRRGRPLGFRLTEDTKNKIREGRTGLSHSQATKDKISESLKSYFKKKDSLADSMEREYHYFPREAGDWIDENRQEIDQTDDVLSYKRMMYLNQIETIIDANSEVFSHNMNPEFILQIKEELRALGLVEDLEEFLSLI